MKGHKANYYIIPESTVENNTVLTIWYEVKANNEKKHLNMHDEDIAYIHHWLSRFVMDVSQKQFIDKESIQIMCTEPNKEMPKSKYAGSYNSVLSYASGIVGQ